VVVRCRWTGVRSFNYDLINCQAERLRVKTLEFEIRFGKKSALISDLFLRWSAGILNKYFICASVAKLPSRSFPRNP